MIELPFQVVGDGTIEIGSVSESIPLKLSVGLYSLRCELFAKDGDGNFPVRIIFTHSEFPEFNVARADSGPAIQGDLLTDADPAGGFAGKKAEAGFAVEAKLLSHFKSTEQNFYEKCESLSAGLERHNAVWRGRPLSIQEAKLELNSPNLWEIGPMAHPD